MALGVHPPRQGHSARMRLVSAMLWLALNVMRHGPGCPHARGRAAITHQVRPRLYEM